MKTCLECKHWRWDSGERGYSEYTPGCHAAMFCNKNRWRLNMFDDERGDVRDKLRTAETCGLFEQEEAK